MSGCQAFEKVLMEGIQRYPVELLTYWPVRRRPRRVEWVNAAMEQELLDGLRQCVERGRPLGPGQWLRATAARLGLGFTLRRPGRPRKTAVNQ